ncbi:hypothetical protein ACFSHP_08360 [Novosphingobium panipatense]
MIICTGEPKAARVAVLQGLRLARASIAADRALASTIRAEIVADLDRELAEARR